MEDQRAVKPATMEPTTDDLTKGTLKNERAPNSYLRDGCVEAKGPCLPVEHLPSES